MSQSVLNTHIRTTIILLTVLSCSVRANAPVPRFEPSKALPLEVGQFRLSGEAKETKAIPYDSPHRELRTSSHLISRIEGRYVAADGGPLSVAIFKWDSDSAAYADVTQWSRVNKKELDSRSDQIGTTSAQTGGNLKFFKGSYSVAITSVDERKPGLAAEFARNFALTLDKGEDDVPVLVKHLPNSDVAQQGAIYVVDASDLVDAIANQPILKQVSFDGGTEAVTANYGQSQLVIVEFTAPQFASDNDQRITAKIQELKNQNQPVPTAYRRVGNYSVFVFNAPDEKTANDLIDQVKYEQTVQWLGDDPYLIQRIERYLTQKTAGTVIAVLESSGLSLVLCLAIGGLCGAILFRWRRARQRAEAYSDAGGMTRLNLDELTDESHKLLENSHQKTAGG